MTFTNKETVTVTNPFDLVYSQSSEGLTLTCVETLKSRQVAIHFDAEATQALWQLLSGAAALNGGTLGRAGKSPTKQ